MCTGLTLFALGLGLRSTVIPTFCCTCSLILIAITSRSRRLSFWAADNRYHPLNSQAITPGRAPWHSLQNTVAAHCASHCRRAPTAHHRAWHMRRSARGRWDWTGAATQTKVGWSGRLGSQGFPCTAHTAHNSAPWGGWCRILWLRTRLVIRAGRGKLAVRRVVFYVEFAFMVLLSLEQLVSLTELEFLSLAKLTWSFKHKTKEFSATFFLNFLCFSISVPAAHDVLYRPQTACHSTDRPHSLFPA